MRLARFGCVRKCSLAYKLLTRSVARRAEVQMFVMETMMLDGSCDCGAVRYTVDGTLERVTECNCGICRRTAGLWAYYSPRVVTMTGPTDIYMRGDRMLEIQRCKTCGCVMFRTPVDKTYDRMGVIARSCRPVRWRRCRSSNAMERAGNERSPKSFTGRFGSRLRWQDVTISPVGS